MVSVAYDRAVFSFLAKVLGFLPFQPLQQICFWIFRIFTFLFLLEI